MEGNLHKQTKTYMTSIKIEKGVPIPVKCKTKYPLMDMEVGDSFLIEETDAKKAYNEQAFVCSDARRIRDRVNPEFAVTTRRTKEGVRVWRTQ